mmetsp:Transcript_16182/g.27699  ORF Transcript_16182/g.27699 Transcript_16182/m.27699 type:complete len:88 (-) Transcript_16182:1023-1286(-)
MQQQQPPQQQQKRNAWKDPKVLTEAFYHFDREGQGRIPTDELIGIISHNGKRMRQDEIEEFQYEADPQGTGWVDYRQFVQVLMAGLK